MKTSIIILTHNNFEYTLQCIESIRRYTEADTYEIIIIDNGSTDDTVQWLKGQQDLKVIYNEQNLGFPKGCNQGMEIAKGEAILLLNNDTVVAKNWLSNLNTALFSAEEIGAVGPVTNSAAYYQSIEVSYESIEEMQYFAEKYNAKINPSLWEERLKLIGFCLLFKREVMERIGVLDEIFTPGNFEDDDYCVRMREEGYKILLCRDTFIHHYGGASFKKKEKNKAESAEKKQQYAALLKTNERKFTEKWKFNSGIHMDIHMELDELIAKEKQEAFSLLELGCGCGANLVYIRNKFKNAKLTGIDKNLWALKQVKDIVKTFEGDIESIEFPFSEKEFDYIILGEILQQLRDPKSLLTRIKPYLKTNGRILISVPNCNYYPVIFSLLKGEALYENSASDFAINERNIRLFNFVELYTLLEECGYSDIIGTRSKGSIGAREKEFIRALSGLLGEKGNRNYEDQYSTKKYILSAEVKKEKEVNKVAPQREKEESDKKNHDIEKLKAEIKNLENDLEMERAQNEILQMLSTGIIDVNSIIEAVAESSCNQDYVLNTLAVKCYSEQMYDFIIPFLQKAYEVNDDNEDVLYNLAYFLHLFGENEMALQYLNKMKQKDEEIFEFQAKLAAKIKQ